MDYDLNRRGWFSAAADFAEILSPASNYPMAYIYALFLAISGHLIGRGAHIRYATKLYPNHYICLVGPSAMSHKSTAIALAMESLGDLEEQTTPLRSLTTVQGLLMAMNENMGQGLVLLDELAGMLTKKRQDFASDLLSRLVELYACPMKAGTYTRWQPIEVTHTFLTLISGSTTEWLRTTLTNDDLMAGFGNRMTFVLGDPRPEKSWPGTPRWNNVDWDRLLIFEGECRLDQGAMDAWDSYYKSFTQAQKASTPFIRVLAERIPEKVLKAALVAAAWRTDHIIDEETLEYAIDWGKYLHRCIIKLTPTFDAPERRVFASIEAGATTRAKLFNTLSHDLSVERIRDALKALRWLGYIKEDGDRYEMVVADKH